MGGGSPVGGASAPLRPQANSELAPVFPELVNPSSASPSRHDKSVSTAFKGGGLNSPVMSRRANNKWDLPTLQIGLTELTRSSPTNQCLICDRSSAAQDEFFFFFFLLLPRFFSAACWSFVAEVRGYCHGQRSALSLRRHWSRADVYWGARHRGEGMSPPPSSPGGSGGGGRRLQRLLRATLS